MDEITNWEKTIHEQTLAREKESQCKSLNLTYSKESIQSELDYIIELEKVFPKVIEYNSLEFLSNFQEIENEYSIEEISQVKLQENKYTQFINTCKKLKLNPSDIPSMKENSIRYQKVSKFIPTYKEWKKVYTNYEQWLDSLTDYNEEEDEEILRKEITDKNELLSSMKKSLDIHTCPHCSGYIRVIKNKLVIADTAPSNTHDIQELEKTIALMEENLFYIKSIKELQAKISHLPLEDLEWAINQSINQSVENLEVIQKPDLSSSQMEKINQHIKKLSLQKELEGIDLSNPLFKKSSLSDYKSKLSNLVKSPWMDLLPYPVNKLQEGYKMKQLIDQYTKMEEKRDLISQEIPLNEENDLSIRNSFIKEQEQLKTKISQSNKRKITLISSIKKIESIINNYSMNDITEIEENIAILREYLQLCTTMIPYLQKKEDLEKAELAYKKSEQSMSLFTQLIERAKILEHTLLDDYLSTLNSLISDVTGEMFDDPIYVAFELFKGDTPNVQLSLLYKGGQNESVSDLSGGEIDRISLAVTISLAVLSPFKYVLLDECFGSLDAPTKEKCLSSIKKLLPHKAVYIIAHGETEGDYEHHIQFN